MTASTPHATAAASVFPRRQPFVDDEPNPLRLLTLLVRRWRVVVGAPILGAVVAAAGSYLVQPAYVAETAFVPEAGNQNRLPSGLAGLASQFGFPAGAEGSRSPRFYGDVLTSREIMERVLSARYAVPSERTHKDSLTLIDVLGKGGRSASDSLNRAMAELKKHVWVRVDNQTSIVRLSVEAPFPTLAASVTNRFVQELNDFNSQKTQSQARSRRIFVEGRLTDSEGNLRRAEEELRRFNERNRSWQQSPQLVFEEGRLRRQVEVQQEVYVTLKREYEVARSDEVNDIPVITVIDRAAPPLDRSRPRRRLAVLLGALYGAVLGVAWTLGAAFVDKLRRESNEQYREIRQFLLGARSRSYPPEA